MVNLPSKSGKLGALLEHHYHREQIKYTSVAALARAVGTACNHVHRIFNGEMLPRDGLLTRIAVAMDLQPARLIALRDEDERIEIANGLRKKPVDAKQRITFRDRIPA